MRQKQNLLYIGLLLLAIVILALRLTGGGSSDQTVLIIAPEITGCVGEGIRHCMQIKYDAAEPEWTLYPNIIDGFDFEPGYEYELLVEEVERGDRMDTGFPYYRLVEIVNKTAEGSG